ncbi:MAG: RING finger protein [Planctomycetota bacterium]
MKARCSKCNTVFNGDPDQYNVLVCTECGAKMRVRPSDESAPSSKSRTPSTAKPEKAASSTPSAGKLPVLMRANKVIAGKECPICEKTIELGVQVHNCEHCSTSHHVECWDGKGGCGSHDCTQEADAKPAKRGATARDEESSGEDEGDTKPCKFCGESIKVAARKCRFCDEYQNERDRQAQTQRASGNPEDENMTTGDWVVAILCSTIGCIAGIVWCIQGKKKGPKMVLVSFIAGVVLGILRVILESSSRGSRF